MTHDHRAMVQRPAQQAPVGVAQPVEAALPGAGEAFLLALLVVRLQPAGGQHGHERERHHQREQRGGDDGEAELPEQLADVPSHEGDRHVDHDVGERDGDGRHADLARGR